MKKVLLHLFVISISAASIAQADYSGHYGFRSKAYVDKNSALKPTKKEKGLGHAGDLTLFKIDKHAYKFWLSANRGWPSYNEGDLDGFIEIMNHEAVFSRKADYADSACQISFHVYPNYISVEQKSGDTECGFGMDVYADGKYFRKDSHKLTNADLAKQYIEADKYKVTAGKALLFEDETGSILKKQYFIKGNIIWGIEEKGEFLYAEYISPNGKFIYGWLKKSDIKPVKAK